MTGLREFVRDRLDNVPAEHQPRTVPAGIAVIVVLVIFLVAGFTFHIPFTGGEGGRLVRAEVDNAAAVTKRTPVRVNGVDIGRVDRVEAGSTSRSATLVMRITDESIDVKRDARARVAWRTLLGQMYVDLDPGSASAPALGDAAIPVSRTSTQVDWDDFNSIFGAQTRRRQRDVIAGFGRALTDPDGHGRTLRTLGPSIAAIGRGSAPLRGLRDGDLRRLVQTTGTTLATLAQDRASLERLVEGGYRTLSTTAGHRRALGEAVRLSPAALRSTALTMRRLVPTLDHLDPLVAAVRPGARRLGRATRVLRPALAQTDRVLRHTRPLLSAAPPALRALASAGREGVPLIEGLRPTVRRTDIELLPYLDRRDDDVGLRVYQGIGPFFSAIASAAGEFDASGHWLHFPNVEGVDSALLLDCDPGLELQDVGRCLAVNQVMRRVLRSKPR